MLAQKCLKPVAALILCPLSAAMVHADVGKSPVLNMVIFTQKAEPQPKVLSITTDSSNTAPLQMVIFTEEAAEQNSPSSAPPDSAGTVTYSDQPEMATPESTNDSLEAHYYVDAGYRRDDLNWNIASPTGTPNILSELQWKKVETAMINTGINITYADTWQAEGNFGYGKVMNGRNQDSDYFLNNRQGEFSRSNNMADDGAIIDVSGSLGYHFNFGSNKSAPRLRLTPKIGYAFHTQQFSMTNGVQTVSTKDITPPLGNFDAILNSTYDATWFGPWGGMAAQLSLSKKLSLQGSVAYHLVDYEGTGNWNLRSDFQHPKSFSHTAQGYGVVASAQAHYLLSPDWGLRLTADYQNFKARHKGIDTTYFSNGTAGETRLNQVNWNSYGFNLGLEYNF